MTVGAERKQRPDSSTQKNAIFVMNPVARAIFAGAPPSHKPAAARRAGGANDWLLD